MLNIKAEWIAHKEPQMCTLIEFFVMPVGTPCFLAVSDMGMFFVDNIAMFSYQGKGWLDKKERR